MAWETHPVTPDRFDDFADVVNPNHRPTHCWCLSHRLRVREIEERGGDGRDARERAARALCAGGVPARAVVCVVVRGGWRRQGVTSQVIEGAVAFAAEHGAPAVEAYPVDAEGGPDRHDDGVRRDAGDVREGRVRGGRDDRRGRLEATAAADAEGAGVSEGAVSRWGDGEREAVLVHGLTGGPGVWVRVGPALAERGFRVTAVTLPGHDGRPAPDGWSREVLVRAVLDQAPSTPYLVIGHSLGGYTLTAALERLRPRVAVYEDPVLDLPAAGPALSAYGEQRGWTREEIARRNPRWRPEAVEAKYAALQGWDPAICDALVDPVRFPAAVVPPARAYGVLSSAFVVADPSALVPPVEAERLRRLGHRVDIVAGAGHSVHHDRFEGFMATVDAAVDAAVGAGVGAGDAASVIQG